MEQCDENRKNTKELFPKMVYQQEMKTQKFLSAVQTLFVTLSYSS